MTTAQARRDRQRLSIGLSIATLAVLLVLFVLGLVRNDELGDAVRSNQENAQANRATICAAARIIALNPVRQAPDESVQHYQKRLIAAGIFLRLASDIDCNTVLAVYGIRAEVVPKPDSGGDAQSPQSGSQLRRAARDRRRRPRAPDLHRLTLDLSLSPQAPGLRVRPPRPASARPASEIGFAH